jgi:hypothetical protein
MEKVNKTSLLIKKMDPLHILITLAHPIISIHLSTFIEKFRYIFRQNGDKIHFDTSEDVNGLLASHKFRGLGRLSVVGDPASIVVESDHFLPAHLDVNRKFSLHTFTRSHNLIKTNL